MANGSSAPSSPRPASATPSARFRRDIYALLSVTPNARTSECALRLGHALNEGSLTRGWRSGGVCKMGGRRLAAPRLRAATTSRVTLRLWCCLLVATSTIPPFHASCGTSVRFAAARVTGSRLCSFTASRLERLRPPFPEALRRVPHQAAHWHKEHGQGHERDARHQPRPQLMRLQGKPAEQRR